MQKSLEIQQKNPVQDLSYFTPKKHSNNPLIISTNE